MTNKYVFEMTTEEERHSLCSVAIQYLKRQGIRIQWKNIKKTNRRKSGIDKAGALFGGCLCQMVLVSTSSADGIELRIPSFLSMAICLLRRHLKTEGLFRKGGSVTRQKMLKRILETGGQLPDQASVDVHDVANLVKQFLRCLAEPLVPVAAQAALLGTRALTEADVRRDAVLAICVLLPTEHLHTLRYLMLFFEELVGHSLHNKMDAGNVAIVLAPNVFVRKADAASDRVRDAVDLGRQTEVIQFLIENASLVGSVPDRLWDALGPPLILCPSEDDLLDQDTDLLVDKRRHHDRKKRNSLNGVFQGLRKMVHSRNAFVGGATVCHDDDAGVNGNEGGADRTPPQALKRKLVAQERSLQCSSAKQRAVLRERSCRAVPIPMDHLDSPMPGQDLEERVFLSPTPGIGAEDGQQRKSGRLKIFGKAYLCSRTAIARATSKSATKPSKKDLAGGPTPQKGSARVARRLSGEDTHTSPTLALTPYSAIKLSRSRSKLSDGCHLQGSSPNLRDGGVASSNLGRERSPGHTPAFKRLLHLQRLSHSPALKDAATCRPHTPSTTNGTLPAAPEVPATPEVPTKPKGKAARLMDKFNVDIRRGPQLRRAKSITHRDVPRALEGRTVGGIDLFTPPRHPLRMASGSGNRCTLRRGRPNTLGTGLPLPPSPQVLKQASVQQPPMVEESSSEVEQPSAKVVPSSTKVDQPSKTGQSPATPRTLLHYTSDPGPMVGAHLADFTSSLCAHDEELLPLCPVMCHDGARSPAPQVAASIKISGKVQKALSFDRDGRGKEDGPPVRDMSRVDSGVFEMVSSDEAMDTDDTQPSLKVTASDDCLQTLTTKSTSSLDSGVEQAIVTPMSCFEDLGGHSRQKTRASCNETTVLPGSETTALFTNETSSNCPTPTPDVTEWRPASMVLGSGHGIPSEDQSCAPRPSIARLLKDKAGTVSATAKKFDAMVATLSRMEQGSRGGSPVPTSPATPSIANSAAWPSPRYITPTNSFLKNARCPLSSRTPCPASTNGSRPASSTRVASGPKNLRRKRSTGSSTKGRDLMNRGAKSMERLPMDYRFKESLKENVPDPDGGRDRLGNTYRAKAASSHILNATGRPGYQSDGMATGRVLRPRPDATVARSKSARAAATVLSPNALVRRSPKPGGRGRKTSGAERTRRRGAPTPRRTTSL